MKVEFVAYIHCRTPIYSPSLFTTCLSVAIVLLMLTNFAEGKIFDALWKFFGISSEDKEVPPPPPPSSEVPEDGMGMDYGGW